MSSGTRRGRSSNQRTEWEVIEIVAEDGKLFQVRWAGNDPETGKPWPLDWIPSTHCSTELVKSWERKKSKKQASLASVPTSTPPLAPGARERPSAKRNVAVASTSEPPVRSSRKRKHRIHSGSPDSTGEDSVPSRRQKLTNAVEGANGSDRDGQSTAHAHSRPSEKDRPISKASLPHPPLEEIELWVPTPNAKFGPPKRKRGAAGERQGSPKDKPESIALPTRTPTQPSKTPPSSLRPPTLSESQIIALREEEEEESQPLFPDLQFPSSPPGDRSPNSAPSDPLPPPASSAGVATEVQKANSLGLREQSIRQPSGDVRLFNPDASKARVSGPNDQSIHIQPNATNASMQGGDATKTLKGITPLPAASRLSLINLNPTSSAAKPPQLEKPAQSGPPPIEKHGATSTEQPTSKNELLRSGNGTLAERRAFEARARFDELRRAASGFGSIAKGRTGALKTIQSPERAPPHVVLKRVMDGMESPSQSQITAPTRNSGNEIPRGASPSEHHGVDPSADRSKEEMILRNKSDNSANIDLLHQQDDVVAADVPVVRGDELSSEDEVPPTASDSRRSQSHHPSPDPSLGSQLAAALDLLHKKSEEISELRVQVASLRRRMTDVDSKFVHPQADKSLNGKERMDYLAVEVQTDRDLGYDAALNAECARWAQEKVVLQGEVDALRGDKSRALADVDFFREQYQRASAFASTTRTENEELLARATVAESQAVNGVAMVRATFDGRVAKLEAEVRKHKALSEMLTERARRTDDGVRYRAALMPELDREFRELHRQFRETEAELDEAGDELRAEKRANVKLRRRLAILEANAPPAPDHDAEASRQLSRALPDDSDGDGDEDYRPGNSPSLPPPRAGSDGLSPPRGGGHSPPNVEKEDDARPPDGGELEQLASVGLDASAQSGNDDTVYLCRWRPGDPTGYCDAVVASRQELHEHVVSHHLSCH